MYFQPSDGVTYAELSLQPSAAGGVIDGPRRRSSLMMVKSPSASFNSSSGLIPVTSPTLPPSSSGGATVYATIDHRLNHHSRLHHTPLLPMANIDESETSDLVPPVPPQFADDPPPPPPGGDKDKRFVTFQEGATPPSSEPAVSFLTASASGDDSVLCVR